MASEITRNEVFKIAGEAQCDPRTVEKIYKGEPSKGIVRARVAAAAKRLRLPSPPVSG